MTLGEVIRCLRADGFHVTERMIHSAIRDGHIPTPEKDGAGRYFYFASHLEKMKQRWAKKRRTQA